jgi:S-DNA-T family DNA segregation ATPase FtsK/SpoIIIE
MSPERESQEQQRLLPASLEDRLIGVFGRVGGLALLTGVAIGWLSLLTWSVTDPSLSHATSGVAQNLLGPLGAILSDLMLQTLGFAAGIALLSPMFWGLELTVRERIGDFRTKLLIYPLAVLLIAGALSALPTNAGWPLHHGFGGILGDVIYALACNILSVIGAERAGAVAGLLFFGAGFAAQARSLGHDIEGIAAVLRRQTAEKLEPALRMRPTGRASFRFAGLLALVRRGRNEEEEPDPGFRPSMGESNWHPASPAPRAVEPTLSAIEPRFEQLRVHQEHQDHIEPELALGSRGVQQLEPDGDIQTAGRGQRFDHSTEAESRAIAERFAPAAGDTGRMAQASRRAARMLGGLARRVAPVYKKPSLNTLKRPSAAKAGAELTQTVLRGNARLLEDVLADFGIKGEIKDVRPGPVVTLFELEPARGTKAARVIGLADDIARSMSASSARVAVVPGRNVIGIELPNARRETVLLREILESDAFRAADAQLPLVLGKGIGGEPIVTDLARMPHLLVAGTTGSGKSVGINAFILSLLFKVTPEECRFLMIDPKMLELSVYNGIPHLLCPVVTEPAKAVAALEWAVGEMEERYKRMAKLSVRNIDVYNNRVRNAEKRGESLARTVQTGFDHLTGQAIYEQEAMVLETMPYIVIVVDEFADLMIVAGKEIEAAVQRLAQMARAAGIHLIMATQRPSVDIVTGTIKANFPTRISFKVASRIDSRTILNEQGAEQLLGQGDMLFSSGNGQMLRVHGAFVADEEVEGIARYLREQGAPRYVDGITDTADSRLEESSAATETSDDIYDKAVAIVLRDRKASTSYLQRRLSIGYNRAADLIERMEVDGVIGPANTVGKRDILAGGQSASAA